MKKEKLGVAEVLPVSVGKEEFKEKLWDETVKCAKQLRHSSLNDDERKKLEFFVLKNAEVLEKGLFNEKHFSTSLSILNKFAAIPSPEHEQENIFEASLQILAKNLAMFEEKIEPRGSSDRNKCILEAGFYLASYGGAKQREIGVSFLTRHIDDVEAIMESWNGFRFIPFFEAIIRNDISLQESDKVLTALKKYFENRPKDYLTLVYCLNSQESGLRIFGESVIQERALPYGVDGLKFLQAWRVSTDTGDLTRILFNNFLIMSEMEEKRPGAAKFLNEKFGIFDFARYPKDMLLSQFDNYENDALPYGVIFYPRNDFNGKFYSDHEVFNGLFRELEGKYLIRIAEGEGKLDIVKMLHRFDGKYGKKHKISFAVIGGHGTAESIQFGGKDKNHKLEISDLQDKRSKKGQYFEDNPTLILISCETGFEDGIGQELSKLLHAKVLAPKGLITTIKEIAVRVVGNVLDFSVESVEKGVMRSYRAGKQVPESGSLPEMTP